MIEELTKAAEAATVFCNKCGYMGKSEPSHIQPMTGKKCGYSARKVMWCDPDTILKLIAAIDHYEDALLAAFPIGASGAAAEHWNDARKELR